MDTLVEMTIGGMEKASEFFLKLNLTWSVN